MRGIFAATLLLAACGARSALTQQDAGPTDRRIVDSWWGAEPGCPPGASYCKGRCVDLSNDPANCGACGNVCGTTGHPVYCPRPGSCVNRQCEHHPGLCLCGYSWVNPETDNDHCGGCGNECATTAGFSCQGGACACGAGMTDCGGKCVDTAIDPTNCGACGFMCAPGTACVNGKCSPQCCYDAQNGSEPPSLSCSQGATWIAWEYVPSCDLLLVRIELHTNGGGVALLQDAGGKPGALLAQATMPSVSPPGWTGGDLAKPIPLQAGTTYWLAESTSYCSIAASGVAYTYYGGNSLSGSWDGPFKSHHWTSHLIGACE